MQKAAGKKKSQHSTFHNTTCLCYSAHAISSDLGRVITHEHVEEIVLAAAAKGVLIEGAREEFGVTDADEAVAWIHVFDGIWL